MTPAAPAQPRNTERCPQCGYRLEGLRDAGQCPECGLMYDQSLVVVDGWLFSRDASGSAYASRRPAVLLSTLASNAFVCFILFNSLRGSLRWLGVLPLLIAVACYLLDREQDDVPPMQLLLGPTGRTHRNHPAASNALVIRRLSAGASFASCALLMAMGSPRALLIFAGFYALAFLIAVAWQQIRRRRQRVVLAQVSGQDTVLTPWEAKDQIILERIRPGAWRIAIGTQPKRLRSFRLTWGDDNTLRFEADLSDQRIEHLAAQMASWPVKLTVNRGIPRSPWWRRLFKGR